LKNPKKFIKKPLSHKKNILKNGGEKNMQQLKIKLPQPTMENPYAQVDFIFNEVAKNKFTQSTSQNYLQALSYYKKFLSETSNYDDRLIKDPRFFVDIYWDEFALWNLQDYILNTNIEGTDGYLTSHTVVGYFSAIRQTLKFAYENNLAASKEFLDTYIGKGERETEIRESYSKREQDIVMNMIREELDYVFRVLSGKGYKKTGVGRDPRVVSKKGRARDTKAPEGVGWKELDNLRWYFENMMDCKALAGTPNNVKLHRPFFANAAYHFKDLGGLKGIYKKWGVASLINAELLMPLAIKLISETGLNAESLWDLNVDCFNESHPLSGVPYIKYYKVRSDGEKEMHLSKKGSNEETTEFRENQAKIIRKTIEQIKGLTKDIREQAPDGIKNKLFIYQSDSTRSFGEIKTVTTKTATNWCSNMVKKHDLKSDDGNPLSFNFSRFRPTRITNLVERGYDFFEIQHEAGHTNIRTTLNYLSRNRLNIKAKEETNLALQRIFSNSVHAESTNPAYATKNDNPNSNVIYKGIMCDCRNPYDPPKEVKQLKDYQDGQACTRFNMCLFCHNVILFKKHLPIIAVYKSQIDTILHNQNSELPNDFLYKQTLDIINQLLDPEKSEFSEDDINNALAIAETMDLIIDPVVYKPIEEH
jgi:integrase